jgi:vacuolar-type H+-ATPase catalytic subunit A/Vma1
MVSWEEEELKSTTLEESEQKILGIIAKDFDSSAVEIAVIKQRMQDTQNLFQEEIQKYATLLKTRREREIAEVRTSFDRKIQKLKELQQQKIGEIEKEVTLELQVFYKQQKEGHIDVKKRLFTFVGTR